MNQTIIDLYDRFTHGEVSRRDFMDRLTRLAGSSTAAAALMPLLTNDYARAETVPANDPRLAGTDAAYPALGGEVRGYMVHPKAGSKWPAVIVIHENRGLNPHIRDVARRIALEGFVAFAPDMLSPLGGTPSDEDKARDMFPQLKAEETTARLVALVGFLQAHPLSTGSVGAVGFCWGGGMVQRLAIASPELKAAVPYYGAPPDVSQVKSVRTSLLLQYAGLDTPITSRGPAFAEAMRKAGAEVEMHVYEGANHAFNNDTNAARYNKEAAELAWGRTIAFLKKHLGAPAAG